MEEGSGEVRGVLRWCVSPEARQGLGVGWAESEGGAGREPSTGGPWAGGALVQEGIVVALGTLSAGRAPGPRCCGLSSRGLHAALVRCLP